MRRRTWLAGLALLPLQGTTQASEDVTAVLRRQSQELVDAITNGSAAVWERYLDEKATYTGEDGAVMTKAEMVGQIKPLPEGVSGNLEVTDFKVTLHGPVAVATYVNDEH